MKKAASIYLRAEICRRDVDRMIRWMESPNVIKYLNEDLNIVPRLKRLNASTPEPMQSYHFNRLGRFFMVCRKDGEGVGFVRLMPGGGRNAYEIVYVIGEESLWGQGLGESAVRCAQAQAFLELRAERMVAKIMPQNRRSIRCVCACGFESAETGGELLRFEMTSAAYFQRLREA